MKIELKPVPNVAHEKVNKKLQQIWKILVTNKDNGSFVSSTYNNGDKFNVIVEWALLQDLTPIKIRGALGNCFYSISIDHIKNEISIRHTSFVDKTLVFSNQATHGIHSNKFDGISATEWCIRPVQRAKRIMTEESIKEAECLLDLIIKRLTKLFERSTFDKVA